MNDILTVDPRALISQIGSKQYAEEGTVEVDGDAKVSPNETGAYIQAWVYVDSDTIKEHVAKLIKEDLEPRGFEVVWDDFIQDDQPFVVEIRHKDDDDLALAVEVVWHGKAIADESADLPPYQLRASVLADGRFYKEDMVCPERLTVRDILTDIECLRTNTAGCRDAKPGHCPLESEDERDHRETLPGQPGYDTGFASKIDTADAQARSSGAAGVMQYLEAAHADPSVAQPPQP